MDKLSRLWSSYMRRTKKIHVQWKNTAIASMRSLDPSLPNDLNILAVDYRDPLLSMIAAEYRDRKSCLEKRREVYVTALLLRLKLSGNRFK